MTVEDQETGPTRLPPESFWRRVMAPDEKRLEDDRQFWSKQYGREVTLAETSEIHQNLFGLVRLLMEVQARQDAIAAGQRVIDDKKAGSTTSLSPSRVRGGGCIKFTAPQWAGVRRRFTLEERETQRDKEGPMKLLPSVIAAAVAGALCGCFGPRLVKGADLPQAEGSVRFHKTRDDQTRIDLAVKHLTQPEELVPPAYLYVAWVRGDRKT